MCLTGLHGSYLLRFGDDYSIVPRVVNPFEISDCDESSTVALASRMEEQNVWGTAGIKRMLRTCDATRPGFSIYLQVGVNWEGTL